MEFSWNVRAAIAFQSTITAGFAAADRAAWLGAATTTDGARQAAARTATIGTERLRCMTVTSGQRPTTRLLRGASPVAGWDDAVVVRLWRQRQGGVSPVSGSGGGGWPSLGLGFF